MRTRLLTALLLLISTAFSDVEVTRNRAGEVVQLRMDMQIIESRFGDNGEVRIVAQMESGGERFGLVMLIAGKKAKKGERTATGDLTYRYPVILEPIEGGKQLFDRLLGQHFPGGAPATLFKPAGYTGTGFVKPSQLGQGGMKNHLGLSDPGLGEGIAWSIAMEVDMKKQTLKLVVRELTFG